MSWEMVKLGEIVKMVTGKTPPTSNFDYFDGDYLWINPSDFGPKYIVESKRTVTQKAFEEKKCNLLPKGTILLSCIGDIGKVGILATQGTSNQQITGLITKGNIYPEYLYYYLMHNKSKLESLANKAVVAILNNERLRELEVVLPPLPIQKRIAEILDAADALKRKDQELLKKYDELAQAIFIEMFGDPVKNEKGWECLTGEDYANRISVGVVIKPASYYVKEGVPALRSQNIRPNRITKDNLVYFSEETNDKVLFKSKVFTGDVLIVRTGQPGTAAVVEADINGINCIDMLIVTPKKEIISPYYLAFFLNSDAGKNYISSNQKGQIQQHFNVGDINKFKIPIPPIGLQLQFEKILLNIKDQLSNEISGYSNSLFQTLLQKAFKGELVLEVKNDK